METKVNCQTSQAQLFIGKISQSHFWLTHYCQMTESRKSRIQSAKGSEKIFGCELKWIQNFVILNSASASPASSISSGSPINPGHETEFYQHNESHPMHPSYKYPMNYFSQLHPYPHFELFQHSRLFYPPIGDFNGESNGKSDKWSARSWEI